VSFSTSISLAVSDLGIVAALTGAIGATSLGYVLPGFLFWKITGNEADERAATQPLIPVPVEELASSSVMRNSAIALLVLGAILMPAGVALTLTQ